MTEPNTSTDAPRNENINDWVKEAEPHAFDPPRPMRRYHPPKEKHERFVGNTDGTVLPSYLRGVSGIRLVQPAYDIYGEELVGMSAIITTVHGITSYNRIMELRFSNTRRGIKNPE